MWPFTSAYPERRAEDIDGKTYDYVIVGGGCAGCVLASRLSEDPSVSVLVLEKGRVRDNWLSRVPLLSQNFRFPFLQAHSRLSEPMATVGGRRTRLWTAEAIGGATRVNGTLLTRGVPGGFNDWAESFGLSEWDWRAVEPVFRRSENAVDHPGAAYRGFDGPLESRQVAPRLAVYPYFEKMAEAVGLPVHRDINDPAAPAQGYFYLDMTIDGEGRRLSAYRVWLNRKIAAERRKHLAVCTGVIASRLVIDEKGKHVTGVEFQNASHNGPGLAQASSYSVRARREVIVCSGTICTPQLLLLSGIGPKDKLEDIGIPVVHDLPQVGRNLTDHCSFPVGLQFPMNHTLHQLETFIGILWNLFLWFAFGSGLLASSSTPTSIFLRSCAIDQKTQTVRAVDEVTGDSTMDSSMPHNVPDVEIMLNMVNSFSEVIPGMALGCFYTTIVQPFSRGRVELSSRDPEANPRITYPLLTDDRDRTVIRRGLRFAMRLADALAGSGYTQSRLAFAPGMGLAHLDGIYAKNQDWAAYDTGMPAPLDLNDKAEATMEEDLAAASAEQDNSPNWSTVTDAEIDAYARLVGTTALHFSSTCRMSLSPAEGVVDQKLRVHGLTGLRIADASVFPKIPSAHTMAPTVMVAERCADFLKSDWAERKTS